LAESNRKDKLNHENGGTSPPRTVVRHLRG